MPSLDLKHDNAAVALTSLTIGPDGKPVVAGCQDGQLLLYFAANRKRFHALAHKGEVHAVAAAPVGKLYALRRRRPRYRPLAIVARQQTGSKKSKR